MREFFSKLLDTTDFPPRWHCGLWTEGHGWLHILSDTLIFAAYFAIPCLLFYYIKNREKALERWYELLTENGKLIFFEEHPFINSDSENQFNESKNDLNTLIDPISPGELKKLAIGAGFKKVFEKSTPIDDKHDLFLLVFEK